MVARPPTGTIPESPGSYQFKDKDGRVIYVGKASSLRQRLSNYFQDPRNLHPRTAQMVATAATVEWIEVSYPSADIVVFGIGMHWLVWFCIVNLFTMLAFRKRFGVIF